MNRLDSPISPRSFSPTLFILVAALMVLAAGLAKAQTTHSVASPLIRSQTRELMRSDEEFRLYGSDFQTQQFIADCRLPQTPTMSAIHTHFLYSPQLNAFKLPVNLPVGGGVQFFASVPFLQRETIEEHSLAHTQGVGDASFGLGWNGDFGRRLFFQLRGYGKLPTGDPGAQYDQRRLPLGTGSTDYGATTHAQIRAFDWAYLMAGYNYRVNGDGEAVDANEAMIDIRRGRESGRVFGLALVPFSFMSISARWAHIEQEATALLGEEEETMLDDAQVRNFLAPELSLYVGPHAQLTVQAHLPEGSSSSDIMNWTHDRNALVDVSVAAYF